MPKILSTNSQNELIEFLNKISNHDKIVFTLWILALNVITAVLNYCITVYFAVITFDMQNIFKAVFKTIKFIFTNLIASLFIIVYTELLYFILNILSALSGANSIAFIILIILFTIYLNYYLLLVFCFYYEKSNDNSNNRTELIG